MPAWEPTRSQRAAQVAAVALQVLVQPGGLLGATAATVTWLEGLEVWKHVAMATEGATRKVLGCRAAVTDLSAEVGKEAEVMDTAEESWAAAKQVEAAQAGVAMALELAGMEEAAGAAQVDVEREVAAG